MRVVHLTSAHQPFDVRIMRECKTLAANGYDVTLVAPSDRDDVAGDVKIVAVPRRSGRMRRMTAGIADVFRRARRLRADVYHVHDPELLPAALLLRSTGKRVIYDAHEDVCKSILDRHWVPRRMRRAVSRSFGIALHASVRRFDGVVAAWPNIFDLYNHPRKALVRNFPLVDQYSTAAAVPLSDRSNIVLYAGGLSLIRGTREIVTAMSHPEIPPDAVLELAGSFEDEALAREVESASHAGKIRYRGWLHGPRYREMLSRAKVGLSVLHPTSAYQETLSTKVFEYMCAGLPVVISDFPRWREAIDTYGCGIAVDPLDPAAIGSAIAYLLIHPHEAQAMGERGARAAHAHFNWTTEAQELLKLYDGVLASRAAVSA